MSVIPKWIKDRVPALQNTSWVFMYHRIALEQTDPWDICVSANHFEQHIIWLKKNARVLPLPQFIAQWKDKTLKKGCVALTFDDGYLDNYETAKPLLEKHGIPATFFITTQSMQTGEPFWWDELLHFFLFQQTLPSQFTLPINGNEFVFNLEGEELLTNTLAKKIAAWKGEEAPTTKRAEAFLKVWQAFKGLFPNEQQAVLQTLKKGYDYTKPPPKIMSEKQVIDLSLSPLFTIGVHTVSHSALAFFSKEVQQTEVYDCKKTLESLVEKKLELLAYPYGNYNSITQAVAEEACFAAAFTTENISANNCQNRFGIGRKIITNRKMNWHYFNALKNK